MGGVTFNTFKYNWEGFKIKRVIKSSTTFPKEGSALGSDARNNIVPFGKRSICTLPNGWGLELSSEKVCLDGNTGGVRVSLCFKLVKHAERPIYWDLREEFFGYTPEELSDLYNTLSSMDSDELDRLYPSKYRK